MVTPVPGWPGKVPLEVWAHSAGGARGLLFHAENELAAPVSPKDKHSQASWASPHLTLWGPMRGPGEVWTLRYFEGGKTLGAKKVHCLLR